jgi:hypothetical protein
MKRPNRAGCLFSEQYIAAFAGFSFLAKTTFKANRSSFVQKK